MLAILVFGIFLFLVFFGLAMMIGLPINMVLDYKKKQHNAELKARGEKKQCPYCKEYIDPEATICPHCRKQQ